MPFAQPVPDSKPAVAQNVPAGQGLLVDELLPVPTQLPAVQVPEHVGSWRLPTFPKKPAGQRICALAPRGQNLPFVQAEQSVCAVPPVVARKDPGAHGMGAVAAAPQ